MSTDGGPVFTFSLPRGLLAPLFPVNYVIGDYINIEWTYKECKAWFYEFHLDTKTIFILTSRH